MTELQKQKQRKENVMKLKKIGFWSINIISYILSGLFLIILIISLSTPKQSNNTTPRSPNRLIYNVNEVQLVERNNVVYDDANQSIILSSDELNNYSFDNTFSYIQDNYSTLDAAVFNYNGLSSSSISVGNNGGGLSFYCYNVSFSSTTIRFVNNVDGEYVISIFKNYSQLSTFEFDLTIIFGTEQDYLSIKNVVELDIQANTPNPTPSIFESLTSVLTNFISTINDGVESVIELFWDSENLSLTQLGNLTTIVVGVALCFFLFRLLFGLIRLRG